jgi:hypothetical protein
MDVAVPPPPALLEANRRLYELRAQTQVERLAAGVCRPHGQQPVPSLAEPPLRNAGSAVLADLPDHLGWESQVFTAVMRRAQPFAVLSYCRMLHTLATGRIELKPAAVSWATGVLDHPWQALIVHAWSKRLDPAGTIRQAADPDEVAQTLAFIRYALTSADGYGEGQATA